MAKEVNGGVRLCDGAEDFEEGTEATEAEEGEIGTCITEAVTEGESDFAVETLFS